MPSKKFFGTKKSVICLVVLVLVCIGLAIGLIVSVTAGQDKTISVGVSDDITTTQESTKLPGQVEGRDAYEHAAVASDAAVCSIIGREALQDGGHAVDAAIAVHLCNGVVQCHGSGIGGGGFMTVYNRYHKTAEIIDARETAPGEATQFMFLNHSSVVGGLSIGVPGEIAGYWMAHQRFGKLPWERLFQPTIDMMENGIIMTEAQFYFVTKNEDIVRNNTILSTIFVKDNGQLVRTGEQFTMPLLAETFKKIAAGGERVFYNGDLSQQIVSEIQAAGGIITLEDLKLYSPVRRQPVTIKLNDNTMYSPPPPSSGVVLQLILNILEGFNFTRESISKVDEAILTYHRVLEAFKLSYARRTELGDTSFVDIRELVESMQTGQLAEELRSRITDTMTHKTQYYGGIYSQIDDAGTSHICILDEHGNAVSMTSTINYDFGSQVVGNVTGIIYNDEMDDFSTPGLTNTWGYEPSPANYITPGKRPLSSMSPSIIVDKTGDVVMMAGASGGSRIISSMSLAIINAMWFGDSLEEAIMRPRIHHQLLPTEAGYQPQLNQQIIEGLQSKGHVMYVMGSDAEQAVQGILRRGGWIYGFSDERKGGKSAGY